MRDTEARLLLNLEVGKLEIERPDFTNTWRLAGKRQRGQTSLIPGVFTINISGK